MRMHQLRVLISGAGGSAALSTIIGLRKAHFPGKIIAIDSQNYSAGFAMADTYFVVPKTDKSSFFPAIRNIIHKSKINLILPTSGSDLSKLTKNQAECEILGVNVFASSYKTVCNCNNKLKTYKILNSVTALPKIYSQISIVEEYPVFVKPLYGKGSRNSALCNSKKEFLAMQLLAKEKLIIQEYLPGIEYSVDSVSDRNGKVIVVIVRERIKTDSGISTIGRIVRNPSIEESTRNVCTKLGIIGPACTQFKLDSNGKAKLLEVNPRFGGGSIFSLYAGINLAMVTIRAALGINFKYASPKSVIISRHYKEVTFPN